MLAVAQLIAIAAPASSQDGKISSTAPQCACLPEEEFDMQSKRCPVRAGTAERRAHGSARRPMPKQWVSRTFRTCVPGIQVGGLRR